MSYRVLRDRTHRAQFRTVIRGVARGNGWPLLENKRRWYMGARYDTREKEGEREREREKKRERSMARNKELPRASERTAVLSRPHLISHLDLLALGKLMVTRSRDARGHIPRLGGKSR